MELVNGKGKEMEGREGKKAKREKEKAFPHTSFRGQAVQFGDGFWMPYGKALPKEPYTFVLGSSCRSRRVIG